MSHWTDAKLCQLATLYSKFNNLWDRNHICYYNPRCRFDSYDKIRKSLCMPGLPVTHVLSKLWDLRSDYVTELRKVQLAKKRNCNYRPKKKWFFIMHRFLNDSLDPDEKPSEDSCNSLTSSEEVPKSQNQVPPQEKVLFLRCANQLDAKEKKMASEFREKKQRGKKNENSRRISKACVECADYFTRDDGSLSKCCQEKMKGRNLEKGNSNKFSRRSGQDWIYDNIEKNPDKFSSRGSKRGQYTSSSCVESLHQDQEERSRKFRTTSELRRSTSKPSFLGIGEFSSCANCCIESKKTECNSSFVRTERENNNDFGANVNISSSDFLDSNPEDLCEEDNLELVKVDNAPRVICLEELTFRVVEALNDMFAKICPVDVTFPNSYCTNKTCKHIKGKQEPEAEDETNMNESCSSQEEMNKKENRQTEEWSEDETNSTECDDFDQFGAEVARVLKEASKKKALRLKAAIKQTLKCACAKKQA